HRRTVAAARPVVPRSRSAYQRRGWRFGSGSGTHCHAPCRAPLRFSTNGTAFVIRNDDLGYPIVVSADAGMDLAAFARERNFGRIVVLCDRNVADRARRIARAVKAPAPLEFVLGERRKTLRTVQSVLDALAAARADRTTLVVGVGGGVA